MLKNGGVVAAPDNIRDSASDSDGDNGDISSPTSTIVPPSPVSSRSPSLANLRATSDGQDPPSQHGDAAASERPSTLHPRVAVILGVDRRWYVPLLICRALSVVPAAWWGLRCAFTFLAELLRIRPGMWREGWVAAVVGSNLADWDVERKFRVTEVALAIMWVCFWIPFTTCEGISERQFQCCASAYLSYFFMDCMMSRWLVIPLRLFDTQKAMTSLTYENTKKKRLLNYSPPAVVIRLLATNGLFAYLTSWVLFLSGASSDPRLLLPAWISIATVCSLALT
jgi:hypothetical protein